MAVTIGEGEKTVTLEGEKFLKSAGEAMVAAATAALEASKAIRRDIEAGMTNHPNRHERRKAAHRERRRRRGR